MFATRTKSMLVAGGLALSSAGFGVFAGVASAAPDLNANQEDCWGEVPFALPVAWEVGDPEDAGCVHLRDTGEMSMADVAEAGSNPGHSPAFTASPQTVVP
jgi:hypothetical protein